MDNVKKEMLIDAYVARATPMPTLPASAVRILELSKGDETDVEEIADAVMTDKVLTARMIRLVNSAFWGLRRQVTSIREAIVYLGLHQIRSIVLTTSLFNTFESKNPHFDVTHIWEHGLGCAMISRRIAKMAGYKDLEKAYIAGLMHDIGKVILSQYSLQEYDRVLELVRLGDHTFYDAETEILGVNHTDFATWFKTQWGFAEELAEVIAMHHSPEKAVLDPYLVCIVNLADLFSSLRGLDYEMTQNMMVVFREEYAWKKIVELSPNLEQTDLKRFTFELDAMIDEVKQTVQEIYHQQDDAEV
ncbi:HDOD domain-containing protein [bacterium]|nr:HDOD domain-containing protein [bacterium]